MAKTKKSSKSKADSNGVPKIISAKGPIPRGQLLDEILNMMEEDLVISKKAAKDFMESFVAVIEREVADCRPVNVLGLLKITPRFHTKGQREVNEEFGNPDSRKVVKKYPAKVSVKITPQKPLKDALPSVQVMGRKVQG